MIEPTDEMVALLVAAAKSYDEWTPTPFADVMRDAMAAVFAIVERDYERPLREAVIELHGVLVELVDPEPCTQFDQHGDCQTHGTGSARPCPHARAKEVLS